MSAMVTYVSVVSIETVYVLLIIAEINSLQVYQLM